MVDHPIGRNTGFPPKTHATTRAYGKPGTVRGGHPAVCAGNRQDHINDAFPADTKVKRSAFVRASPGLAEGFATVVARFIRFRHGFAGAACGLAGVFALAGDAGAQGRLDARYVVTLGGLPIGRGAWAIDIHDSQYVASANGTTTGLLRVFASGQGSTAVRGTVSNGHILPAAYASTVTTDRKSEELHINLAGGNVKDYSVDPPTPPSPDRIPVTDAHRRGVTDPMSAALTPVAGTADPVSPEACERKVAIFDGRMRYDLKLAYKRMETVRAARGYQGPAVVCAVYFVPIAGYIPQRAAIKYLISQRDIEAWLAPVAGTRVVVPFRVSLPTPLGLGIMEATDFVTEAQRSHESAFNAKIR